MSKKFASRIRLLEIEEVIATKGWSSNIMKQLAQRWEVTERQVRNIRTQWLKEKGDEMLANRELDVPELAQRLDRIYEKSLEGGKFGAAIGAVKTKAELLGLLNHKIELSTPKPLQYVDLKDWSPEQLKALAGDEYDDGKE